jgi:hypothetical protein
MEWYRVYHGLPQDAKLQVIAKRSNQPMANVVSVWVCLLDAASKHDPRGIIKIDPEEIGVIQDIEAEDVQKIISAFYDKGMIDNHHRLTAWDKRQYTSSTERSRKYREDKKQDATPSNTMQRGATSKNTAQQKSNQKTDTDNRLQNTDLQSSELQKKEIRKTDKKNTEREEKEEREKEKQEIAKQMLQIWNAEVQKKLTKDQDAILTPQRKELLCKRWKEDFQQDLKAWQYYCEIIGNSEFCLGRLEGKDWTIDLSWAVKSSENIAKILEGGFSGGKHPAKFKPTRIAELQPVWDLVIAELCKKYGKPTIRCWFSQLELASIYQVEGGSIVIIICPSKFVIDWIQGKYQPELNKAFASQTLYPAKILSCELKTKEQL